MTRSLANRLAVHALTDLSLHPPKTVLEVENWDDQCGFWLAQLQRCMTEPDQLNDMLNLLQDAVATELQLPIQYICEVKQLLTQIAVMYWKGPAPCQNN